MKKLFSKNLLKSQAIISLDVTNTELFSDPLAVSLFAKAALKGGAKIIKASQYENLKAIRQSVDLITIGSIYKKYPHSEVQSTPSLKEVNQLIELGVEIISLDATNRPRPNESLEEIILYIRHYSPQTLILAECSTLEEMVNAEELGLDLISTSLVGKTSYSLAQNIFEKDFSFIKNALTRLDTPLVAEGEIFLAQDAQELLKLGAFCVIVDNKLINPQKKIRSFLEHVENERSK